MSAAPKFPGTRVAPSVVESLENGDHLDQPTFHRLYKQMPERFRAELIGGIVYVPSPLKTDHGGIHADVMAWLGLYRARTPGTRALDNTTDILGPDSEPQPDASLILEDGQTRVNADGYLVGPPELVVEVASSSRAFDLHEKRRDYEKYGVAEYLVLLVNDAQAIWFFRPDASAPFSEPAPSPDPILRSKVFPGLWLDTAALFQGNISRVLEVLDQGVASPEHAAFVAQMKKSTRGAP